MVFTRGSRWNTTILGGFSESPQNIKDFAEEDGTVEIPICCPLSNLTSSSSNTERKPKHESTFSDKISI